MADPIPIPSEFGNGTPLSARLLNSLQEEILRQLYEHTHEGGTKGPQLQTGAYADRSVTEPKLADGVIVARTISAGAVRSGHIAPDAVTADAIADDAVGNAQIVDGAVSEAKLDANVRLKLNRIGGGVSSASTVIWRDPIIVFPVQNPEITIIHTLYQPQEVYWLPTMIGLIPEDDTPYRLNPKVKIENGNQVLDSYDVFRGDQLVRDEPKLAKIVDESILIAGQEVGVVGAFQLNVPAAEAFVARGGGTDLPTAPGRTGGRAFEERFAAERFMAERSFAERSFAERAPAGGRIERLSSGRRISAMTADTGSTEMSVAASEKPASTGLSVESRQSAAGFGGGQAAPLVLNANGAEAAVRMTTVGVVDQNGAALEPGAEGAYTVAAGFAGRSAFTDGERALDYRDIGNDADRKRAAESAGLTMYNLGLDEDYLSASKTKLNDKEQAELNLLLTGQDQFFQTNSKFWGNTSWLPDLLNNPQLFGSGYAISGGRNILSVTRMPLLTTEGGIARAAQRVIRTGFVRVRFITPYKDSAYSVSVTPRSIQTQLGAIPANSPVIGNIRRKTPTYCDLQFVALTSQAPVAIDKVSFDLAVIGDLAPTE